MNELDTIIEIAYKKNATDIHLCASMRPRIRIDNALIETTECGIVDVETAIGQIFDNLTPVERKLWRKDTGREKMLTARSPAYRE